MRKLSELQEQVFQAARIKLMNEPWFRGVCMDNFPDDDEIQLCGIDVMVGSVVFETAMWDDPTFMDM